MTPQWTLNRRKLITHGGTFAASLALSPLLQRFAWAAEGDTLRLRMDGDLQVLDPAFMNGGIEEVILRGIYTSLIRFGDLREGAPWFRWGAESIEQVDPLAIKFKLTGGMKWSGGFGAVTANDVKFSYERIKNPDMASPWAYQFEKLDRVEVVDDLTGIIHLTEPYPPIYVTTLPYYGGHIISRAGTESVGGQYTTEPPAMCGPYLLTGWEQKQKVTMTANPDWPGPKPVFSTVEVYIVEDDQAAQLAYEAGSFDYTRIAVGAAKATQAAMPAATTLIEAQSTRYQWLTINMSSPRLKDHKVRQAVQYSVDVEQILLGAYDGLVGRSTGVVQPGTPFERSANLIAAPDYEKAQSLLSEAGVSDLSLTLHCMNDSTATTVAQIIQATMSQAGITVEVIPVDEAAYWSLGDKTAGDSWLNVDLVLMDFAGGIDPSENLVWFRPDQVGVYNWSGFDSPEYEALYQKLVTEGDEAKRIKLSQEMEGLMEASGGFIFICHEPLVALHRAALKALIYPDGHPNAVFFEKV